MSLLLLLILLLLLLLEEIFVSSVLPQVLTGLKTWEAGWSLAFAKGDTGI